MTHANAGAVRDGCLRAAGDTWLLTKAGLLSGELETFLETFRAAEATMEVLFAPQTRSLETEKRYARTLCPPILWPSGFTKKAP